jgi:hypothetical protein
MNSITRWLVTAIIALSFIATPAMASAQVYIGFSVGLFVNEPPPAIPVYYQPPVPGPGFIWVPGYWAWGPGGYYWVPGYWEQPPNVGLYWTPGYWSWDPYCGCYDWNNGYWAPQVGFYGGINYGFGYFGIGYAGGYWHNGGFWYNSAVSNVNISIVRNVYVNRTVIYRDRIWNSRVAYNGGRGGDPARPTTTQLAVRRMHRYPPTSAQVQHATWAGRDRNYYYSANHGRPSNPAVVRPFSASRRPVHFTPITTSDRMAARAHMIPTRNGRPIVTHPAAPVTHNAAPMVHHAAPVTHNAAPMVHHAAPAYHPAPVVHHAAPAYHPAPVVHPAAPAYHPAPVVHPAAPAYHPAPVVHHAAPAYHPAPQYRAPAYHPAPQYRAPAYHPAPQYRAPAYHPAPVVHPAAPAYHPAPHPQPHAAAPHPQPRKTSKPF